ncbi:MAG: hypothetical protein ABWZ82_09335 [Candidatus Limnocylindrales bacterium]
MRTRKAGLGSRPTTAITPPAQPAVFPDEPDEAAFDTEREPLPALETSGFQQFGSAMGGVIAGIEQQVFGRRPPGEVEVRQSQPTRGLTGDGTQVILDFPDGGGWGDSDGGGGDGGAGD